MKQEPDMEVVDGEYQAVDTPPESVNSWSGSRASAGIPAPHTDEARRALAKKIDRALSVHHNLFTLEDVIEMCKSGDFQSFDVGDSWLVTRVQKYPRGKVVELIMFVGEKKDIPEAEATAIGLARGVGAKMIQAFGREGWEKIHSDEWKGDVRSYVRML